MSKYEPLTSKSDSSTVIATSPVFAKNFMSESLSDLSVWKSSLPAKHITEKYLFFEQIQIKFKKGRTQMNMLTEYSYWKGYDIWLHEKDMEGEYMKQCFGAGAESRGAEIKLPPGARVEITNRGSAPSPTPFYLPQSWFTWRNFM